MKKKVVYICGPTGAGKTALVEALSEYLPVEVISADSRQVYKYMDIGTNKPSRDVLEKVPHHIINVIEPSGRFSASDFIKLSDKAWEEIVLRGHIPVVAGGTGLYMRSFEWGLCEAPGADDAVRTYLKKRLKQEGREKLYSELQKVDPEAASKIPPQDTQRLTRYLEVYYITGKPISWFWKEHSKKKKKRYDVLKFYLNISLRDLAPFLRKRCEEMIKRGLVDEVAYLIERYGEHAPGLKTIGYREFVQVVKGEKKLEDALDEFFKNTKAYAKRQIVWFKKELNEMFVVGNGDVKKIADMIKKFMEEGKVAVSGI